MTDLEIPKIFICYAHNDNDSSDRSQRWLDRLLEQLEPLQLQEKAKIWSDKEIELGDDWNQEIQTTLEQVKVAILLVSPAFLASKYIRNSEVPVLLKNAKEKGVTILPILLRNCLWQETTFNYPDPQNGVQELSLSTIQMPTGKPLNSLSEAEQDEVLLKIAKKVHNIVKEESQLQKLHELSLIKEQFENLEKKTP